MRGIIGGEGAKWHCGTSVNCPYQCCPPSPGYVSSLDTYPRCYFTNDPDDYCVNNATYICNLFHYKNIPCQNYWHTDFLEETKCVNT